MAAGQCIDEKGKIDNRTSSVCNVSVCEYLYLLYLSVMLFARGIGLYEGTTLYNISLVIGIIIIGFKIILTEHTLFEYIWMALLVMLALIVYKNTGEKGLLVCILTMIGIKGVSIKRVFRTGAMVWTTAFVILTLLALNDLIPEKILMHNKHGIGYIVCHALGYPHPNVLHVSYIVVMMFIMYSLGKQSRKKLYISTFLLMLGNILVFYYSVSFTGFIGATVYLIFNLYFQLRKKISFMESILIQMILPLCILFSIVGPVLIKGRVFELINNALNTRYNLSNYFLTQQPITLLGARFVVPNYRYTMDCSYVYLFMQLGIIPFVLMMFLYFALIRDSIKNKRNAESAIIIALCITGITEPFMFNLSFKNLIFLFAGEYIFRLSEKIQGYLPIVFSRKIRISSYGEREIPYRMLLTDRLCDSIDNFKKKQVCRINIIVIISVMCLSAIVCLCYIKKPTCLYIDAATNENRTLEPMYISLKDMNQKKENGDIFYNYIDGDHPMYPYYGSTVWIEYSRHLLELVLLSGVMAGIVLLSAEFLIVKREDELGTKR